MPVARTPLVVVLIAVAAAAGCGGSSGSSDSSAVKHTITSAFTDLANGDGQGFCSLATTAGQQSLARNLPGSTCATVLTLVSRHLSDPQRQALRHTSVKMVTVKGDQATVKNSDITASSGTLDGILGASTSSTRLTKQSDGSWKLSG